MIKEFYKNFKVRDYMNEEVLEEQSSNQLIDCSLGTNPFIEEKYIKKYIEEYNCEINKYPILEYKLLKSELINFWNEKCNVNLEIHNISFGSGIMGILRNISDFLFQENTMVLGCAPQFPRFVSEVELKKGIYKYYKLEKNNNYKFIVENFIDMINGNLDVIHIENPNNPTGQIINIEDIEKIVKVANKYDIIVLIDEAYGDFMSFNNSAIKLVPKYNNIVVLKSASKFFGLPNHRVGYLFSSKEFIKIYNEIMLPFPFSDLSANIFRKVLRDYSKFESTKEKVIEVNRKIYSELRDDNYIYTNIETPIFTVKTKKYKNLSKELKKEGVIAEDCGYYINLNANYSRIRINKDYESLTKILKQML